MVTLVSAGLFGSVTWFVPDEQTIQTTAFVVFTRSTLLQLVVLPHYTPSSSHCL